MTTPRATKEQVQELLDRFTMPQERMHVPDWPAVREGLREEAKRYGLKLPPYLADEE